MPQVFDVTNLKGIINPDSSLESESGKSFWDKTVFDIIDSYEIKGKLVFLPNL